MPDVTDKDLQGLLDIGQRLMDATKEVSRLNQVIQDMEAAHTQTIQGLEVAHSKELEQRGAELTEQKTRWAALEAHLKAGMEAAETREQEATVKAEYWLSRVSGLQARTRDLESRSGELVESLRRFRQTIAADNQYKPTPKLDLNTEELENGIRELSVVKKGPAAGDAG